MRPLLDTGESALWTPDERERLGRCHACEWDPAMQGHHPYCPKEDG